MLQMEKIIIEKSHCQIQSVLVPYKLIFKEKNLKQNLNLSFETWPHICIQQWVQQSFYAKKFIILWLRFDIKIVILWTYRVKDQWHSSTQQNMFFSMQVESNSH